MTLGITTLSMLSFISCSSECHYPECLFAECHYSECLYVECIYVECYSNAECRYAECHYAKRRYAKCCYVKKPAYFTAQLITSVKSFTGQACCVLKHRFSSKI